jgi:hypothetical protein
MAVHSGAPQDVTTPEIDEVEFDGADVHTFHDRGPGAFAHHLPDGRLIVLDAGNPTGLKALSTDASNRWILELTEDGVLRHRDADALDSPPVELGRGYIAAGW